MKRNHTKILSVTLAAALIVSLLAIPTDAKATKKLMITSPKSVTAGKSIKIKTNIKCSFKSSNKKIATVNSNGVVKGKKAGKVTITVTAKKGKQKKAVKITVKKAKVVVTKTPSTAAPNVNATRPPSIIVTSNPSVTTPTNTARPSTSTPIVPPTNTANPSTTNPLVVPPTDTANPSQTPEQTSNPMQSPTSTPTSKIIDRISAEPKGKNSSNNNTLQEYDMIVKAIYSDGTEETIRYGEFDFDYKDEIQRDGKVYQRYDITYLEYSTVAEVEVVELPTDVIHAVDMLAEYNGTLKKGEFPSMDNVENVMIFFFGGTKETLTSNADLYWGETFDLGTRLCIYLVYDYIFEYNGERFCTATSTKLYINYE